MSAPDSRIVLIGEAPGPRTLSRAPLFPSPKNSAGYKLYELTGLENRHRYLTRFQRANLLRRHPGTWKGLKRPKDRWPTREARFAADAMLHFMRGRTVIIVGRRVATAFGHSTVPFLEWRSDREWGYKFAIVPHTSGRNHFYNEPGNRDLVRAFFEDLLRSDLSSASEHASDSASQGSD